MFVAVAGFLSGILSGMGIGGGMILIPALTIFCGAGQHAAQTVNLFYFIPTSAAALAVHLRDKNVALRPALKMAAAGLFFALAGAWLASAVSDAWLRRAFGVFIGVFGIREIYLGLRRKDGPSAHGRGK